MACVRESNSKTEESCQDMIRSSGLQRMDNIYLTRYSQLEVRSKQIILAGVGTGVVGEPKSITASASHAIQG
jgi:hypothetical protein